MALSETRPRITVLGTGYLGATHAICMAVLGHEVLGIDTDKQKTAYEMSVSDWSSDVCSSDLQPTQPGTASATAKRRCWRTEERRVGKEC